jgi:hypothetical protein
LFTYHDPPGVGGGVGVSINISIDVHHCYITIAIHVVIVNSSILSPMGLTKLVSRLFQGPLQGQIAIHDGGYVQGPMQQRREFALVFSESWFILSMKRRHHHADYPEHSP